MTERWLRPGLAAFFFVLYLASGLLFHFRAPVLFEHLDQVWDADLTTRIADLTRRQGPHEHAPFHPLFVLLLNPPGRLLRAVLRAGGVAESSGRVAAIMMCAAAGGAAVAGFLVLLRRL